MLCLSGFELYQSVELMFEGRRCFNLVPSVLSYTSLRSKLRRVGERPWERGLALFVIKMIYNCKCTNCKNRISAHIQAL